jgi:hypothetical protein
MTPTLTPVPTSTVTPAMTPTPTSTVCGTDNSGNETCQGVHKNFLPSVQK